MQTFNFYNLLKILQYNFVNFKHAPYECSLEKVSADKAQKESHVASGVDNLANV